jgi:Glycosyl hydrolases family 8
MTKRLSFGLVVVLAILPLACGGSTARRTPGNNGGGGGDEDTGGKGSGGSSTGGKSGGTGGKTGTGGSTGGSSGDTGGAGGEGGGTGGAGGSTGGAGGEGTGGAGGMSEGGSGPAPTGHLFGSHSGTYPMGSIRPAGSQASLDAAVKAAYDKWKAAYVTSACGGTVVKSTGETNQVTSSPALGLGMIITAMMAGHDPEAQKLYDGMLAVARKFPSYLAGHAGLLCYAVVNPNACARAMDCDSTVDGDLDFGFALTLGNAQWGNGGAVKYGDEAAKTIPNLKQYDFSAAKLPLLGDWASLPDEPAMWKTTTKPPYYMLGHLRAFAKQSNDMFWMQAIDAIQTSIAGKANATTGLLPVILINGTTLPTPTQKVISDTDAGSYAGDAGSIPFRLAADVIASGDMRSKMAVAKINAWIKMATGGDPGKIVDGYRLDGTPFGTKGTMAFVAPFGAAAVFDPANQAWLDAIWKMAVAALATDQATDGINLLSMLVMSGNWWNP